MAAAALILGAAYTALLSGLRSYSASAYRSEIYTVLERSLHRIFEDLTDAHMGEGEYRFQLIDDTLEIEGLPELPNDRLLFTSNRARTEWRNIPQSDLSEVEYYIDTDEETPARWLVRRTDSPPDSDPTSGGEIHLIGPKVVGMQIEAFDGAKWLAEWDSTDNMPKAVRVSLYMLPGRESLTPGKLETLGSMVWLPRGQATKPSATPGTASEPEPTS